LKLADFVCVPRNQNALTPPAAHVGGFFFEPLIPFRLSVDTRMASEARGAVHRAVQEEAMTYETLPKRLKLVMDRRPRTVDEVESIVDEIEQIIRALEQQQLDLTKRRLRKKE
jgi:hypothetical protein